MHIAEGGLSRTQFIAAGAVAAGAAVAAGVTGGPVEDTDAQTDKDVEALQLLLLLEYTETAFYTEALDRGGLSGEVEGYAEAVLEQEREHLAFVREALGSEGGRAAALRVRRGNPRPGRIRLDRGGAGGPGRGRLQRPGDECEQADARGRGHRRVGGGAPRGLDSKHRRGAARARRDGHAAVGGPRSARASSGSGMRS